MIPALLYVSVRTSIWDVCFLMGMADRDMARAASLWNRGRLREAAIAKAEAMASVVEAIAALVAWAQRGGS